MHVTCMHFTAGILYSRKKKRVSSNIQPVILKYTVKVRDTSTEDGIGSTGTEHWSLKAYITYKSNDIRMTIEVVHKTC